MKGNKGCKLDFNLPYFKFNFATCVSVLISPAKLQQKKKKAPKAT